MSKKLKVEDIVATMKAAIKAEKKVTPNVEAPKPTHRERNMQQEALDMGAYGMDMVKEGLPLR